MGNLELIIGSLIAMVATVLCLAVYLALFSIKTGKRRPAVAVQLGRVLRKAFPIVLVAAVVATLIVLGVVHSHRLIEWVGGRVSAALSRTQQTVSRQTGEARSRVADRQLAPLVADHSVLDTVRLAVIDPTCIQCAKEELHIVYVHSEVGRQIRDGVQGLAARSGGVYEGLDIEYVSYDAQKDSAVQIDWNAMIADYLVPGRKALICLCLSELRWRRGDEV